ncbi:MAG: hypothetical protein KBG83_07825 [Bacteroidetes bacterium]|nr:hypothetical protein [Bacteroidota bacterium]
MRVNFTFTQTLKNYFIRYPAMLSGIIIYGYLFFAIVVFLLKFHHGGATLLDVVEMFDALPFLWLLAYSLVKIITLRNQYLESENKRLLADREVIVKETQLKTLHDVARAFRHRINTPLTIINFEVGFLKKKYSNDPNIRNTIATINEALDDITKASIEFAKATAYPIKNNQDNNGQSEKFTT